MAGIDLSPEMIACARRLNPGLDFRVGDLRHLDLPDSGLVGIVAFYAIVHFESRELPVVMREMRRVMSSGGLALVAFHIGNESVHLDDLFGAPVNLDFWFHDPSDVIGALRTAPFAIMEHIEREPYEGAEYPSRRCYLLAKAT